MEYAIGRKVFHHPSLNMNKPTVSQKALKQMLRKAKEAHPTPKPRKREDIFSRSRDLREDRDTRQVKSDKSRTFPHVPHS